ncbi:FAD-binding oxidoreductase [Geobacter argillaceus]|uniref:4-cresol dehydrogenase (Hydroxylating) n=1 Tax=Geobacter argillaceus TaxID=345631 RepID=A0A562V068_9BACT|nr:FAD-binding oxidoreductase [Geobacter argillaceus]TWJ11340.1 4-cresol dehydrogenase (hydroxylating) [Geobacter argillaceus]
MSRFAALPKGVTEESFAKAIQEYRALLGENRVRVDPASLEPYLKITIAESAELHKPSAALCPSTVKEVQTIVAIANKYKTPLWTVCNGENEGYGSSAPATPGQIVVDLKNMNKIIEVDQELAYCHLEPGVTYNDLYQHLKKKNINLWLDVPASAANVSIIGNTLERGCGYTPYSEKFIFSCGMEVVLPNATLLRTGMGGIPNSTSTQVFKWGYGPYVDGLFSQGNSGIVTKLGIWLMPPPPPGGYMPFCMKFSDVEMIGEIFKPLMFLRETQIVPNACAVTSAGWEAAGTNGKKTGAAAWSLYGAVYGTPEQVALNWSYVSGAFKKAFGSRVRIITDNEGKDDPVFQYRKQLMMGVVSDQVTGLDKLRGRNGGYMRFSPTASARPAECRDQVKVATRILHRYGFDYIAEFIVGWRDARHNIEIIFDRTKPEAMKKAYSCYDELMTAFTKRGWLINRTNTAFMDKVANTLSPEVRRINRTIKMALDPNNIMAPGKSGITLA